MGGGGGGFRGGPRFAPGPHPGPHPGPRFAPPRPRPYYDHTVAHGGWLGPLIPFWLLPPDPLIIALEHEFAAENARRVEAATRPRFRLPFFP